MKRVLTLLIFFAIIAAGFTQTNLLPNGDLELLEPNFWAPVGDGASMTWSSEGYDGSEHSFMIEKIGVATDIVGWKSVNNADLYWNNASADALYNLGFWVKTVGVNTGPSDDAKIGVKYEFYNAGASLGTKTVWIDQSAADMDWTQYTDGLLITPGFEPDEIYVTLFMGKDATGTVYFDNVGCGTDPWSMGIFNGNAEVPSGWLNWASSGDVGYANLDSTYAYSGKMSAKLMELDDLGDEMVFYSEPIVAEPSTWYQLSVWVKHTSDSVNAEWIPTNITDYKHDARMNLCFFSHAGNIMTEWSPTGGDRFFYFDERETDNDWTLYTVLYKTEEDATGLSVRARFNNFTRGTCWFDDFTVEKVELGANLLPNGDLELLEPNFWAPVGDGATMTWSSDGYDGSEHSFKIDKTGAATDIVGWKSVNNADLYWNNASADALYNLGFWVKTVGVNTGPSDDAKIGVKYEFYNAGASLGAKTVWIDQSAADMDWTQYTDGLLITPGFEPDEIYVTLFMGKDATGTVYFDNVGCGTDPWSMGIFNGNAEVPSGWLNWASSGDVGYANLNDTHAHSGTWSAMLMELDDLGDEMVFYSEPIVIEPSTWYLLTVWAMHTSDSVNVEWLTSNVTDYKHDYRMNLCFFSHAGNIMTEWSPTGGDRFFYFDEREAADEFDPDWIEYTVKYKTEEDATGFSMRARFNNFTKGTCWFDDFAIQKITHLATGVEDLDWENVEIPKNFELFQNYPNPFNPTTQIGYILEKEGHVELEVFNVMGQSIRTLVDEHRQAGMYKIMWDGRDESGNLAKSGIYFYQLRTADNVVTKSMVFVK